MAVSSVSLTIRDVFGPERLNREIIDAAERMWGLWRLARDCQQVEPHRGRFLLGSAMLRAFPPLKPAAFLVLVLRRVLDLRQQLQRTANSWDDWMLDMRRIYPSIESNWLTRIGSTAFHALYVTKESLMLGIRGIDVLDAAAARDLDLEAFFVHLCEIIDGYEGDLQRLVQDLRDNETVLTRLLPQLPIPISSVTEVADRVTSLLPDLNRWIRQQGDLGNKGTKFDSRRVFVGPERPNTLTPPDSLVEATRVSLPQVGQKLKETLEPYTDFRVALQFIGWNPSYSEVWAAWRLKYLQEARTACRAYDTFLNKVASGAVVHREFDVSERHVITDFNRHVGYLARKGNNALADRLEREFAERLRLEDPSSKSQLLLRLYCREIWRRQKVIEVEQAGKMPIPLHALKGVAEGRETEEMRKVLKVWIDQVACGWVTIPFRTLDKGIRAALHIVGWQNTDQAMARIYEFMIAFGAESVINAFEEGDDKQLLWRRKRGKEGRIGALILHTPLGSQRYRGEFHVYTTLHPYQAVVMGRTPFLHMVKREQEERIQWGLPLPRVEKRDLKGRFEVMEQLLEVADPLKHTQSYIQFLRYCVQQQGFPSPCKPSDWFVDREGKLKTLQPMIKGSWKWEKMEALINDLAKGNRQLYAQLMRESGMVNEPAFRHYQNLIISISQGEDRRAGSDFDPRLEADVVKIIKDLIKELVSLGLPRLAVQTAIQQVAKEWSLGPSLPNWFDKEVETRTKLLKIVQETKS